MRLLLGLIAIAAIVVIALLWTGMLKLNGSTGSIQVTGTPPSLSANMATVTTGTTNVTVPTISVQKPGEPAPAATARP